MSIFEELNHIERIDEVTPREYQPDDFDAALIYLKRKGNIMDKELAAGISMLTYTGKTFYPYAPKKEDICIEDIAHSLALQCRFGGHTPRHYSVAEHCLIVAELMRKSIKNGTERYSDEEILAALLHDAATAYFQDMITPHQKAFPNRRVHELKLQTIIFEWAGLRVTRETMQMIDTFKRIVFNQELFQLFKMKDDVELYRDVNIVMLSWYEAQRQYIDMFASLSFRRK